MPVAAMKRSGFSKALELDRDNPWTRWFLGRAYLLSGNSSRAIEEMETGLRFGPDDPLGLGFTGYVYAVTGRRADALKILQRLDELQKRRFISTILACMFTPGLATKTKLSSGWRKRMRNAPTRWRGFVSIRNQKAFMTIRVSLV